MSEIFAVKDIAKTLDIKQHTVLALIRSGQLKAFNIALKPGGKPRWRISAEALAEFIASRTHQPAAPRRRRRRRSVTPVKKYFS